MSKEALSFEDWWRVQSPSGYKGTSQEGHAKAAWNHLMAIIEEDKEYFESEMQSMRESLANANELASLLTILVKRKDGHIALQHDTITTLTRQVMEQQIQEKEK